MPPMEKISSYRKIRHNSWDASHRESSVKYILSAEFDNKVGSVIKHQVPRKIPGFKENLSLLLPELMIPLNSELKETEDYNCIILYLDRTGKYSTIPDTDKEMVEDGQLGLQYLAVNEINTIFEKNDKNDELDDILFFYNVTKKIKSETDERGSIIRSIAIGTPLRNFVVFKPFVTLAIERYINDGKVTHLSSLYDVLNDIDISIWSNYLKVNSRLHNILSLSYDFNNRIILNNFKSIPMKNVNTQSMRYKNGLLQFFGTLQANQDKSIYTTLPLNFSLSTPSSFIQTDLNVTIPILRFLLNLMSELNTIDYRNLNIVVFSKLQTTDYLCQFILSLSNFFNGYNNNFFHNDKILYFPILDLYNWEKILEFNTHSQTMKFIGTNNVILKDQEKYYDLYYDLDQESITRSTEVQPCDSSELKTSEFMELLARLLADHQDISSIKVSFQRFNIWQILRILNDKDSEFNDSELDLKDYYLIKNKNLVIFQEFFEFQNIRLIESLNEFFNLTSKKFGSFRKTMAAEFSKAEIVRLSNLYFFFNDYISKAAELSHIELFIFIVEIFPTSINIAADLIYDVDLKQRCCLNDLFKPIFLDNPEIQTKVLKLFEILMKSSLRIVLEERLNKVLIIALGEYAAEANAKVLTLI